VALVGGLALATLLGGCAPVPTPTPGNSAGLFQSGTIDDAATAVPFHVLRPSYLPDGARVLAVEYSAQPANRWVVQRYAVGQMVFYIKSEPLPAMFRPQRDAEVTVKGRPTVLSARRASDGGIAEWLLYYVEKDVVHTVAGELPAEELIRVAADGR
jgi:hypothetical protein